MVWFSFDSCWDFLLLVWEHGLGIKILFSYLWVIWVYYDEKFVLWASIEGTLDGRG